jgi:hypothetical protein
MPLPELIHSVSEFISTINDCYGMYLDGSVGFEKLYFEAVDQQKKILEGLVRTNPKLATKEYVDSTWFVYGEGDPNDPKNVAWHITTHKQYLERNARQGINRRTLARNCIVAIFEYWNCEYRKKIAVSIGKEEIDIKLPILGDIRLIRNAILHNKGRYTKECMKTEIIKGFSEGEEIDFDTITMFTLTQAIKTFMDEFVVQNGGEDPKHRDVKRIR